MIYIAILGFKLRLPWFQDVAGTLSTPFYRSVDLYGS